MEGNGAGSHRGAENPSPISLSLDPGGATSIQSSFCRSVQAALQGCKTLPGLPDDVSCSHLWTSFPFTSPYTSGPGSQSAQPPSPRAALGLPFKTGLLLVRDTVYT